MSDRKKSGIPTTAIGLGVAAVAGVAGFLYWLNKDEEENNAAHQTGTDDAPLPPCQPRALPRVVRTRIIPQRLRGNEAEASASTQSGTMAPHTDASTTASASGASTNTSAPRGGRENIEVCIICLASLQLDDDDEPESAPIATPCDHYFHLACIRRWVQKIRTCPICNTPIPEDMKAVYF